jgi:biopolymer transport protein ExbD
MKPNINVTPLIDVLLVLLIIFMVITPLKPTRFEAKLPAEKPETASGAPPDPNTLVVFVRSDGSLGLNNETALGSIDDPEALRSKLAEVFRTRERDGIVRYGTNEIEKTVFVQAPTSLGYGAVVRAIDAVKESGAGPIGLKLDNLD